jgi:hypothetical protein
MTGTPSIPPQLYPTPGLGKAVRGNPINELAGLEDLKPVIPESFSESSIEQAQEKGSLCHICGVTLSAPCQFIRWLGRKAWKGVKRLWKRVKIPDFRRRKKLTPDQEKAQVIAALTSRNQKPGRIF